jgi:hypothetical protein
MSDLQPTIASVGVDVLPAIPGLPAGDASTMTPRRESSVRRRPPCSAIHPRGASGMRRRGLEFAVSRVLEADSWARCVPNGRLPRNAASVGLGATRATTRKLKRPDQQSAIRPFGGNSGNVRRAVYLRGAIAPPDQADRGELNETQKWPLRPPRVEIPCLHWSLGT